jgi:hypothetical protein
MRLSPGGSSRRRYPSPSSATARQPRHSWNKSQLEHARPATHGWGGTRSRRSIHSPSSLVTECAPLSCSASPSAPSAASSAIAVSRQPAKAARPGVRRSNSHSNTWSTPTWQAGWSASGSHHSPGPRPLLGALIVRLGQLKMFYARACQPFGGGGVAEPDVAGVEQRADGVQVDAPVAWNDRQHVAGGLLVSFDSEDDALRCLGGGVSAQGADGVRGAVRFVIDELVGRLGGVEQGDQALVGVIVGDVSSSFSVLAVVVRWVRSMAWPQ